jgi:hypothetical protein
LLKKSLPERNFIPLLFLCLLKVRASRIKS